MQRDLTQRPTFVVTVLLALAAAACQSKTTNGAVESATGDTSAVAPTTGAARTDSTETSASDSSSTRKGGLNDETILGMLDGANKADSVGGAMAAKKATDPEVKAFGQMMMKDHHDLRVSGEELAKQLGVTPKPPAKDPIAGYVNAEMVALQKAKKGEDFDKAYIENEVTVHQAVLDAINMARVTTSTAELKTLIQNAIPVIQQHLEQAQTIQKRLSPTA